jgi:hypothetical protein
MPKDVILHPITVVNKHKMPERASAHRIYIGRGSPLGNPYSHKEHTKANFVVPHREAAVAAYEALLIQTVEDPTQSGSAFTEALRDICRHALRGPVELVCFCKPQSCHGDVIKAFIEKAYAERNN